MKNKILWCYIEEETTRSATLCAVEEEKIKSIFARVWQLDSGEWAYACNSELWGSEDFFLGIETSRKLAIEVINKGFKKKVEKTIFLLDK